MEHLKFVEKILLILNRQEFQKVMEYAGKKGVVISGYQIPKNACKEDMTYKQYKQTTITELTQTAKVSGKQKVTYAKIILKVLYELSNRDFAEADNFTYVKRWKNNKEERNDILNELENNIKDLSKEDEIVDNEKIQEVLNSEDNLEQDELSNLQKGENELGKQNKGLEKIDITVKNDKLVISLMDYYSQERKLFYSQKDFINVHTAVKCSNLTILSGLSGTGKSALVDIYAKALGINNNTENPNENRLLFIPVRPSWNDDSDLLGYVDLVHMVYRPSDTGFIDFLVKAQKEENKNKMFLVCFDEMNLARVEHYFSQFLSILERPKDKRELQLYDKQYIGRLYNSVDYPNKIKIGDNIRFIGTVNIDESTYHFSDKVLDRANVIQLDVLNYAKNWIEKPYAVLESVNWSYEEYSNLIKKDADINDINMKDVYKLLWDMHELLQSVSTKYGIGPRIVKAIESYIINIPKGSFTDFDDKIGLDYQIVQRVLTKVRGPENQLGDILKESSENNFYKIFENYKHLSDFEKCKSIVAQKQKELETYGYCM